MAWVNRGGINRHNSPVRWHWGRNAESVNAMNQIVIRNLDDIIIQRLKQLAWQDGRSFDDMARRLLVEAVRSRAARRPLAEIDSDD